MGSRMLPFTSNWIKPNSFQCSLMVNKKEALKDTGVTPMCLLAWKEEVFWSRRNWIFFQTNCFLGRGKTMSGWKGILETGMEEREYRNIVYLGFWSLHSLLGRWKIFGLCKYRQTLDDSKEKRARDWKYLLLSSGHADFCSPAIDSPVVGEDNALQPCALSPLPSQLFYLRHLTRIPADC